MSESVRQSKDVPQALTGESAMHKVLREFIWRPARKKNDWRVFVVIGREGSGKSLTCASILKAVDPKFTTEFTHFEAVPFLKDISSEMGRPGRATMLDEAGVAFGKRTWQDKTQVRTNQALQTARDDNRIIGLTLPRLEELDSQLQGRVHMLFKTQKVKDGSWVKLKPLVVDPTRLGQGQEYHKYPKVEVNGRMQKIRSIKIGPPPQSYVDEYEPKKTAWKGELFGGLIDDFEGESDDGDEWEDPRKVAEDILQNDAVEEFVGDNYGQRYIDTDMIALEYELGNGTAKKVKKALQQEVEIE